MNVKETTKDYYILNTPKTHYSISVVAHMIPCFISYLVGLYLSSFNCETEDEFNVVFIAIFSNLPIN